MAAGSTYTPIATTTLGSDTAYYDFNSISGSYTDLLLVGQFGNSSAGLAVGVQFNGDTANNYAFIAMSGSGSGSGGSDKLANSSIIYAAYNIAPSATVSGLLRLNIFNYANTTTFKTITARYDNNDATYPGTSATVGSWRKTPEAINSIRIKTSAGNLKAGSTFTLYGIQAA
jgi:hypothetical protein